MSLLDYVSTTEKGAMKLDTPGMLHFVATEKHLALHNDEILLYEQEQWIDAKKYLNAIYSQYPGYNANIKSTINAVIEGYSSNPLLTNNIKWNTADYIEFNNGIYSFASDTLLPKTYDKYQTIKIDCNYIEDATSEILDKTLEMILPDERTRESYLSYLGYIFYKDNLKLGKWAVNYGLTHTCKSTIGNIIVNLLNRTELVAMIQPRDLGGRFINKYTHGKLLLYCDDLTDGYIDDTGAWKSGATGSIERIEAKGKDSFTSKERSFCKLIANSNTLLKTKEGQFDDAMKRRTLVFPFNEQILENDPRYDPELISKLYTPEVEEALVYKSIQAFKKVLQRGEFDETDEMKGYLRELIESNRQHEALVEELNFDYVRCEDAYKEFKRACNDRNMKPMTFLWFKVKVHKPVIANHFMSGKPRIVDRMWVDEALTFDKNAMDNDHLKELGFKRERRKRNGVNKWRLFIDHSLDD